MHTAQKLHKITRLNPLACSCQMRKTAQMADDDRLTTAEVAAILGRSVPTINRWAANGRLPVVQQLPGSTGARLFLRRDVERLRSPEQVA